MAQPTGAEEIADRIAKLTHLPPEEAWQEIRKNILTPKDPFKLHKSLFDITFKNWNSRLGPPPVWVPDKKTIDQTHIGNLMKSLSIRSYEDLHTWSVKNREKFWQWVVDQLKIKFDRPYDKIVDLKNGVESPRWLVGAELNITNSCFKARPDKTAIIYQRNGENLKKVTYDELNRLSNRVANGLIDLGLKRGDRIAIDMIMSLEAVAIYLGIIKLGCVAVSIADSLAPNEIATRIRISSAKAIFTQDYIMRGTKKLSLYEKIKESASPKAIVVREDTDNPVPLRKGDIYWQNFLSSNDKFNSVICKPDDHTNILFSSGTTGDPKAIPWTHTTPIKCAMDAYMHHDIHEDDIIAWPTNLGWMMGPWLIYASLINNAAMALYYDMPKDKNFGEFIQNSKVTMLGLVPSLVKVWRETACMEGLDWSSIKAFSSTGECSNSEDYLYLMSLIKGYRPVIEYCGGTEIGGGYITQTLVQPASPATFSTPSLGLDLFILDENGKPTENGEVFIAPPSIGLSTELLNKDHHEVYFKDTPTGPNGEILRRHGDQMQKLANGFFQAHGRADDTMNLGGIKVSSAEIEKIINSVSDVSESAAIAVTPKDGGPSQLVIYTVLKNTAATEKEDIKKLMQKAIGDNLNPLFKIHDVLFIDTLPRTASNKVMRRVLRDKYTG